MRRRDLVCDLVGFNDGWAVFSGEWVGFSDKS